MLPRANRLKKKRDIGKVLREGKGFKEDLLVLKFMPNKTGKNRFGIIVSKKVSKSAAIRNRTKRRIGNILKMRFTENLLRHRRQKETVDAVFIASPGLETKKFREMEKIIKELFKKAKLTKNA